MNGATAATVAWNLPLATKLTINGSVDWQGIDPRAQRRD